MTKRLIAILAAVLWLVPVAASAEQVIRLGHVAFPVRQLGIDPIHFGIIITINLGVGQQTPPVATVLFTTSAIAGLPFWEVFKAGWLFALVLAVVTLIVTYYPPMSLFLVDLVFK